MKQNKYENSLDRGTNQLPLDLLYSVLYYAAK